MQIQENVPLKGKTTMRIGGSARYFAKLNTQTECDEAIAFAAQKNIPLIVLGSGANTIFSDGIINALVVQIAPTNVDIHQATVRASAGKNLAMLINELAKKDLDLSALTGIPGTLGGAIFGNAGQGPEGIWIDSFVTSVVAYVDGGWRTFTKDECQFGYRDSIFKYKNSPVILWEAELVIPSRPCAEIERDVQALLLKRIETQPHLKTAGSCFKAKDRIPAWRLIDEVGLRGQKIGDVQIAEKHANFLLNVGEATYDDAVKIVDLVRDKVGDLHVEMRFIEPDGSLRFD